MRKQLYIGVDTSCYMTSVACCFDGRIMQYKRPVVVKTGSCGLRQSEALFQHIKSLPVLFEEMRRDFPNTEYEIMSVAVSSKPRSIDNSYMPVFLAGESAAKVAADMLGVPLIKTSHQDGHIMAVLYSENKLSLLYKPFISVHLSGGTSEILLCRFDGKGFNPQIIGGTKDLPAGQFIDRIGVLTGCDFPCGKYLDYSACNFQNNKNILSLNSKISIDNGFFNFSGEETKIRRMYEEEKINRDEAAYLTMNYISQTVKKAVVYLMDKYEISDVIMAGGVSASNYLRNTFSDTAGVYFAIPEFSGDNAAGVVVIGKYSINGLE